MRVSSWMPTTGLKMIIMLELGPASGAIIKPRGWLEYCYLLCVFFNHMQSKKHTLFSMFSFSWWSASVTLKILYNVVFTFLLLAGVGVTHTVCKRPSKDEKYTVGLEPRTQWCGSHLGWHDFAPPLYTPAFLHKYFYLSSSGKSIHILHWSKSSSTTVQKYSVKSRMAHFRTMHIVILEYNYQRANVFITLMSQLKGWSSF